MKAGWCSICGKKIHLDPPASERVRKFGGKAQDYYPPTHSTCQIKANQESSSRLALARRDNQDLEILDLMKD